MLFLGRESGSDSVALRFFGRESGSDAVALEVFGTVTVALELLSRMVRTELLGADTVAAVGVTCVCITLARCRSRHSLGGF